MKPNYPFRAASAALALTLALGGTSASAQLRVPSLNLPLPDRLGPLDTNALRSRGERLLGSADLVNLGELRLGQIGRLLRQHRDVLEADPRGEPVVRREILAWAPSPAGLAAARKAGMEVVREQALDALGAVVVLRVPDGADLAAELEKLRALDPEGSYDFNHIYTGSSTLPLDAGANAGTAGAGPARQTGGSPDPARPARVGLIDSGVDGGHAVFRDADIRRWGCGGTAHPAPHGTAVAALMVGQSAQFRGVVPSALLYAADIYCDSATGGSADKIAGALAWLASEQVGVINISLVGPPNILLERVVATMVRRGHVLVAAVGNDGPAAPPLYPASYRGVVGVTGVDKRGRTLPEAARGPQVMFAAPGNQMVSAAIGRPPYRTMRGTSFAAPIVAALLAPSVPAPSGAAARSAIDALAKQAGGGASNTVSNETGYGVVGMAFRNDPSAFR
ncbi:S8 family serine peptidase [Massilia sp. GCM10020059]|uniref:S8 family serine peptidase n=1 Tax=Massilia agrisoli TaxID=2892444 RepID=A0ABS8IZ67_9BURK|nr:S8 family serine peptidase [Massilia agrisoli]MCC6073448.1 S8 family serine peptidase [Massilia agrisoli]